jgi:Protein of unknown function (DUF3617)
MVLPNRRCTPTTERTILSSASRSPGERSMTRQLLAFCLAAGLLMALHAADAGADELPIRKPGLWEMKMVKTGSAPPDLTMQHCTDETTDKAMSTAFSPMSKEVCSKREIQKTSTGYVSDAVCSIGGMSITSHSDITGDFNSAYTVKTTSHSEHGPSGLPRDSTMTIEAKWLGACKPDQKPGDIVMPGGFKINTKDAEKLKGDAEKLKALLPK